MKVLEVITTPIDYGGQVSFTLNVIRAMEGTDVEIDVLTTHECRNKSLVSQAVELGSSVYALELPCGPKHQTSGVVSRFRKFLKAHQYDIVHIHADTTVETAMLAAVSNRSGSKVIVHAHIAGVSDNRWHDAARILAGPCMRKYVDTFCACSLEAAHWMYDARCAREAIIVTNGIDISRFKYNPDVRERMRRELGVEAKRVIGHVGRFEARKNQKFLASVFGDVFAHDQSFHLLLVGDGDERQDVEDMVRDMGLTEHVTFTGGVNNVQDYLQAMDLFVFPSLFEGVPYAVLEAQAAGLPVIASRAIPVDVAVTTGVWFIDLADGVCEWSDSILLRKDAPRIKSRVEMIRSGCNYDIAFERLKHLYLSKDGNPQA